MEVSMFCSNCGKAIEEGSKFCKYCGTGVEKSEIGARQEKGQEVKDTISYYDTPKILPSDMLQKEERIIFETRPHKGYCMSGWWTAAICFFIIPGVGVLFVSIIGGVSVILLGLLLLVILPYLSWRFTFYSLTTQRIVKLKGILEKDFYENRLEKIQDLRLKQSLIQRLYGCGDILITTAGKSGIECVWKSIPHARNAYSTLRLLVAK